MITAQIRGSLLALAMVIPSQAPAGEGVETRRAAPRTGEGIVQTTNREGRETDSGMYALAAQVDTDLFTQTNTLQGGAGTAAWDKARIGDDSADYTGTNETAITDPGIRGFIQTLDDANVPQRDRVLVIPPVSKNTLLGLARFTEQAFVGEVGMANSIRNGRLGNIYGVEVFVSTQCPTATGAARIGVLMHKSALGLVMQQDIRVQTQYKAEYLADLLVADTLYGVGELRDDAGVAIAVTA